MLLFHISKVAAIQIMSLSYICAGRNTGLFPAFRKTAGFYGNKKEKEP